METKVRHDRIHSHTRTQCYTSQVGLKLYSILLCAAILYKKLCEREVLVLINHVVFAQFSNDVTSGGSHIPVLS